jgi:hypothetical protein
VALKQNMNNVSLEGAIFAFPGWSQGAALEKGMTEERGGGGREKWRQNGKQKSTYWVHGHIGIWIWGIEEVGIPPEFEVQMGQRTGRYPWRKRG